VAREVEIEHLMPEGANLGVKDNQFFHDCFEPLFSSALAAVPAFFTGVSQGGLLPPVADSHESTDICEPTDAHKLSRTIRLSTS